MIENEILSKVNSEETNENIILKRDEEGKLIKIDCEEIVKRYLNKNSINYSNINIKKTNEGLSNYIFYVTIDDKLKLFLKIFNNQIDRKFEEKIITLNAEQGNCARILDTDYNIYRIEEFLENIQKLEKKEVLNENFVAILTSKIIKFNFLLTNEFNKCTEEKNVFRILEKTFLNAQKSFKNFKDKFDDWKNNIEFNIVSNNNNKDSASNKDCFEKTFDSFKLQNYEKIEKYLSEGKLKEILSDIFPNDFLNKFNNKKNFSLNDIPLFLSHNDVHLYNFLYRTNDQDQRDSNERILNEENILLIDYEYACFNIIGFDFVNFFIECFFNLEFPDYPFYEQLEKSTKKIYDKSYYDKYVKFLYEFLKELTTKGFDIEKFSHLNFVDLFGTYEYYCKICRLASIYWFYTALQFLDFDSNINKSGFNYIDYSIDRLSIYENFYN